MSQVERTRRWRARNPDRVAAFAAQHRDHMRDLFAAEHPGVPTKPHWTAEEEARLRTLAPTHTTREAAAQLGRSTKGVSAKALRLGVSFESPDTNTALGRIGERIALTLLAGARHVSAEDYHAPFDLEWAGQRIDVKTCRGRFFGCSCLYPFEVEGTADAFLCLALEGDELRRAWLIPASAVAAVRHVALGAVRSKYGSYELEGVA